jgi:hypothetical protein
MASPEPKGDARAIDTIWRVTDGESFSNVPLSMVLTYYQRPSGTKPGGCAHRRRRRVRRRR